MNLVGPITIDTMPIRSPSYSMRLFSPEGGGGGDSPLLDLLGFAAGKNGNAAQKAPPSFTTKVPIADTGFNKRKGAKFTELNNNFMRLVDWLCIGR